MRLRPCIDVDIGLDCADEGGDGGVVSYIAIDEMEIGVVEKMIDPGGVV